MTNSAIIDPLATLGGPVQLGSTVISNRLVAQPMERSAATDQGEFTPELVEEYLNLARGQWGIIHLEAMTVSHVYKSRRGQLVVSDQTRDSLASVLAKLRSVSPKSLYLVQLTVPGVVTGSGLQKTTIIPAVHEADPAIKLLSDAEIEALMASFKRAIDITIDAGIDGIDIKACHGYLGVEFLRPANSREGKYGGLFENRVRFIKDLVEYTRDRCLAAGKERFLIGSRVSVVECIPGGVGTAGPSEYIEDLSEVHRFCSLLCDWGANFVNVTAGIPATQPEITRPSKNVPWGIFNHFRLTKAIKDELAVKGKHPAIIGSAYSMLGKDLPTYAAKNIRDGAVDLIGLGRQILADPAYPAKLFARKPETIHQCIGCSNCAQLLRQQKHVGCTVHDERFKNALKA